MKAPLLIADSVDNATVIRQFLKGASQFPLDVEVVVTHGNGEAFASARSSLIVGARPVALVRSVTSEPRLAEILADGLGAIAHHEFWELALLTEPLRESLSRNFPNKKIGAISDDDWRSLAKTVTPLAGLLRFVEKWHLSSRPPSPVAALH